MSRTSGSREVSIRLRLEPSLLERIDRLVGKNGRQHFIKDAILWRLEQDLPPIVLELVDDVEELKKRVDHLESSQSASVYMEDMSATVKEKVCRDDFDRRMLAYFLQHSGATSPELAKALAGSSDKRRTIHDRIVKLNERAVQLLGVPILAHEKGIIDGKRGAWWIINTDRMLA
ncbi:MAG: hypothetical protein JSW61_14435 [Candidatus Thorarchaeota archaeon]|nr:MAG: hypothetical protein JSW61_14435 [Candidatus Thorarchaeota archaeon]